MNKLTIKEKICAFLKRALPSIKWIIIIACGLIIGALVSLFIVGLISGTDSEDTSSTRQDLSTRDSTTGNSDCNVLGINIHGEVFTYNSNDSFDNQGNLIYDQTASENVVWSIKDANDNPNIKAIIIEVDSGGGSAVGGEEISNAVKNSEKPVVAYIRDVGASAAYLAISSADKIFASVNSDVGSIGVTLSYLSNVDKNNMEGYTYEQLAAGKYKNSGNPDKVLTSEERTLLMRDVNIMFENFVSDVAQNRGLTVKAVKSFADGSTVMGEKAKELGMIDEIGGLPEVENYLEEIIGEKPEGCW